MTKMTPFRMIGNLYFVGTKEASSHLIDTSDGLILIDTGYEETADVIAESVSALGFDIKDVKITRVTEAIAVENGEAYGLYELNSAVYGQATSLNIAYVIIGGQAYYSTVVSAK